jgi:hypothetical protein
MSERSNMSPLQPSSNEPVATDISTGFEMINTPDGSTTPESSNALPEKDTLPIQEDRGSEYDRNPESAEGKLSIKTAFLY